MKASVYKLHIAYKGLEEKIWRDMEVSSNYLLNRLGYAVLATFDTLAYHLFEFHIFDVTYFIPNVDYNDEDSFDMADFKISHFQFNIGDSFTMDYDYGTTQTFVFTVTELRPLEKGTGRAYPKITAGEGCGIIDDMHVDELSALILQIEKNGKADQEIYYNGRSYPWDFRPYNMAIDNALLKGEIDCIGDGYAPFWE